jgi:hypothetical protein
MVDCVTLSGVPPTPIGVLLSGSTIHSMKQTLMTAWMMF